MLALLLLPIVCVFDDLKSADTQFALKLPMAKGVVIRVQFNGPEAHVRYLRDTIAAPLGQKFHRLEGLVHQVAVIRHGVYDAFLIFLPGTDANETISLVQNQIAFTRPLLPPELQKKEITVKFEKESLSSRSIFFAVVDGSQPSVEDEVKRSNKVLKAIMRPILLDSVKWLPSGKTVERPSITLFHEKFVASGVSISETMKLLMATLKETGSKTSIDQLKRQEVTSNSGKTIRLESLAEMHMVQDPEFICQVDMEPAILITGLVPANSNVNDCKKKCRALLENQLREHKLAADCKVIDLTVKKGK